MNATHLNDTVVQTDLLNEHLPLTLKREDQESSRMPNALETIPHKRTSFFEIIERKSAFNQEPTSVTNLESSLCKALHTYSDMIQESVLDTIMINHKLLDHFHIMNDFFFMNNGMFVSNLREKVIQGIFCKRSLLSKSIIELGEALRDVLMEPSHVWEQSVKGISERLVFGCSNDIEKLHIANS